MDILAKKSAALLTTTDRLYSQTRFTTVSWEHIIAGFFNISEQMLETIHDHHNFVGTIEVYRTFSFLFDFRAANIPIILSGPSGVGKSKSFEMISSYDASASKFSFLYKPEIWKIVCKYSSPSPSHSVDFLKTHHAPWKLDSIFQTLSISAANSGKIYQDIILLLSSDLELITFEHGKKTEYKFDRRDNEDSISASLRILNALDDILAANLFYSKTLHANVTVPNLRRLILKINKLASTLLVLTTKYATWVRQQCIQYKNYMGENDLTSRTVQSLQPPILTVFLDELNTTPLMTVLSNLFVHHSFGDTLLSQNIWLCGAINPKSTDKALDLYAHVYPMTPSLDRITIPFPSFGKTFDDQFLKRQGLPELHELLLRRARDFCQERFKKSNKRDTKILTSVSLRDCSRFVELYRYFSSNSGSTVHSTDNQFEGASSSMNDITRSGLLQTCCCWLPNSTDLPRDPLFAALALAFYLRLDQELRLKFKKYVFRHSQKPLSEKFDTCLKRMSTRIYEIVSPCLPKTVCKTEALGENLYASVTAIILKLPIFLIGAPGSSKTLSYNIIQDATSATDKPLVPFLGRIRTFRIQGSELLSANQVTDLITTAEKQEALQQEQNTLNSQYGPGSRDQTLSQTIVVFFDETSLPSRQKGTLKSLHKPLDDRKIAFIGVGNNPIGTAIQNRALCVMRPDLDTSSIYDIAKVILQGSDQLNESRLRNLLKGYQYSIKEFKIHSSRDFIQLLQSIRRIRAEQQDNEASSVVDLGLSNVNDPSSSTSSSSKLLPNDDVDDISDINSVLMQIQPIQQSLDQVISSSLARNFLGLEKRKQKKLLLKFLKQVHYQPPSQFKQFFANILEPKRLDSSIPVRFPLLMDDSPDDSALRLVIYKSDSELMRLIFPEISKIVQKFKLEYFSQYPVDNSSRLYAASYLFRLTQQMNAGDFTIISHADPVSGALFDVLNQRFTPSDDPDYLEAFISISKIDRKERIHKDFNMISHVSVYNTPSPYSHLPTAYLSRFEKFRISFKELSHELIQEYPPNDCSILQEVLKRIERFFIQLSAHHPSILSFDYHSFFVNEILNYTTVDKLLEKPGKMNVIFKWNIDPANTDQSCELIYRWFICSMIHSLPPSPFLPISSPSSKIVPYWAIEEYLRDEKHFKWAAMIEFIEKCKRQRFWMIHRPDDVEFSLTDPSYRVLRREDPCFESSEELENSIAKFLNTTHTSCKKLVFLLPSNFSSSQIHHLRSQLDSLFTSTKFQDRKIILVYTGISYPKVSIEWRHFWLDVADPLFSISTWFKIQFHQLSTLADIENVHISDNQPLEQNLDSEDSLIPMLESESVPRDRKPFDAPLPSKQQDVKTFFGFKATLDNAKPIFPSLKRDYVSSYGASSGSGNTSTSISSSISSGNKYSFSFLKDGFAKMLKQTKLQSFYPGIIESPNGTIYEIIHDFWAQKLDEALNNVFNFFGSLDFAVHPGPLKFYQNHMPWFYTTIDSLHPFNPESINFGPTYYFLTTKSRSPSDSRLQIDNIPKKLKRELDKTHQKKTLIADFLRFKFQLTPEQADECFKNEFSEISTIEFFSNYSRFPLHVDQFIMIFKGINSSKRLKKLQFESLIDTQDPLDTLLESLQYSSDSFNQLTENGNVFKSISQAIPDLDYLNINPNSILNAADQILQCAPSIQKRLFLSQPLDYRYIVAFPTYMDVISKYYSPLETNHIPEYPVSAAVLPDSPESKFLQLQQRFWAISWVNSYKNNGTNDNDEDDFRKRQELIIALNTISTDTARERFKSILVTLLDFETICTIEVQTIIEMQPQLDLEWFVQFQELLSDHLNLQKRPPPFRVGDDLPPVYDTIVSIGQKYDGYDPTTPESQDLFSRLHQIDSSLPQMKIVQCLAGAAPWRQWPNLRFNQDLLHLAENIVRLVSLPRHDETYLRNLLIHSWAWAFKPIHWNSNPTATGTNTETTSTLLLLFTSPHLFWGNYFPSIPEKLATYHWDCLIQTSGGSILSAITNLGTLERAAMVFISVSLVLGGLISCTSNHDSTKVLFTSYFKGSMLHYLSLQLVHAFNSLSAQLDASHVNAERVLHHFFMYTNPNDFGLGITRSKGSVDTLHRKFSIQINKMIDREKQRGTLVDIPRSEISWTPVRVFARVSNLNWKRKHRTEFKFCQLFLSNYGFLRQMKDFKEVLEFRFNLCNELASQFTIEELRNLTLKQGMDRLPEDRRDQFIDRAPDIFDSFSNLISLNPEFQVACGISDITSAVTINSKMDSIFSFSDNIDKISQVASAIIKLHNSVVSSALSLKPFSLDSSSSSSSGFAFSSGSQTAPYSAFATIRLENANESCYPDLPEQHRLTDDLIAFLPEPGKEPKFDDIVNVWAWKFFWTKPLFKNYTAPHIVVINPLHDTAFSRNFDTSPTTLLLNARTKLLLWRQKYQDISFNPLKMSGIYQQKLKELENMPLRAASDDEYSSNNSLYGRIIKMLKCDTPDDFAQYLLQQQPFTHGFVFYYLQSLLDRFTTNPTQFLSIDSAFQQIFTCPQIIYPDMITTDTTPDTPFKFSLKGLHSIFSYHTAVVSILSPDLFYNISLDDSNPESIDLFLWLKNKCGQDTPNLLQSVFSRPVASSSGHSVKSRSQGSHNLVIAPTVYQIVSFFNWLQTTFIPDYRQRIPPTTIEEEIQEDFDDSDEELDLKHYIPAQLDLFPYNSLEAILVSLKDFVDPVTLNNPIHKAIETHDESMFKWWICKYPNLLINHNSNGDTPISLLFNNFNFAFLQILWDFQRYAFKDYSEHFDPFLRYSTLEWEQSAEEKGVDFSEFSKSLFLMQNPDI